MTYLLRSLDLEGKWIGFLKDRVTGSLRKCLDEAGNSFEKSKTETNPQKTNNEQPCWVTIMYQALSQESE